jgi:hypothetical protein
MACFSGNQNKEITKNLPVGEKLATMTGWL